MEEGNRARPAWEKCEGLTLSTKTEIKGVGASTYILSKLGLPGLKLRKTGASVPKDVKYLSVVDGQLSTSQLDSRFF